MKMWKIAVGTCFSKRSVGVWAMIACAGVAPCVPAQWTATSLHPAGDVASRAQGVGIGQQVGFTQTGNTVGTYRASLWSGTAGSWVNLHPAGGGYSIAYAVDAGVQVGEVYPEGLARACLWSGTAASWVNLHPVGPLNSSAYAVSGGQQVGTVNFAASNAALWTGSAASFINLNPAPTDSHASEAFGVHAGKQVGYVVHEGVIGAAMWSGTAASWVNLHPAGNISSWAYGIENNTQVGMVRVANGTNHAALWHGTAASFVDLHPAGALNSRAAFVRGGMTVGYADVGVKRRASLWTGTAASWVDLSAFLPAGYGESEANAIWTDGTTTIIAGRALKLSPFRDEAFLWTNKKCTGDLNGDGVVDDADFIRFALAYNILDCTDPTMPPGCPSDLNGDGVVDDADFTIFVVAYNAFLCP